MSCVLWSHVCQDRLSLTWPFDLLNGEVSIITALSLSPSLSLFLFYVSVCLSVCLSVRLSAFLFLPPPPPFLYFSLWWVANCTSVDETPFGTPRRDARDAEETPTSPCSYQFAKQKKRNNHDNNYDKNNENIDTIDTIDDDNKRVFVLDECNMVELPPFGHFVIYSIACHPQEYRR